MVASDSGGTGQLGEVVTMNDGSHVIGRRHPFRPGHQDLTQLGSGVAADPTGQGALGTDDVDHGPRLEVSVDAG